MQRQTDPALEPFREYQPLPLEDLRQLPAVDAMARFSGVYFLWGADGRQLVYIGQAKDIAKRIAGHRAKPPAPFYRATYLRVAYPWQLAIERLYIDRYFGEASTDGSGVCLANCG